MALVESVSENVAPSGRDVRSSVPDALGGALPLRVVAASGMPCRSSSSAQPLTTPASDRATPSTPPPSSTARVSTCSASTARCRVSYCSATTRVNTASVIAMNGTG